MQFALWAFLICFLLIASGGLLLFYREALGQRLASVLGPRDRDGLLGRLSVKQAGASLGSFADSLQKVLPKSEKEVSVTKQKLILAGYRKENHTNVFYAAKAVMPVMLAALVAATGVYRSNPFIIFITALAAGYLIPDYVLGHLVKSRQMAIRLGLPDVMDLMVVCLEAGLSLDQAVLRTAEELRFLHPALCDELGLVMLELRAGRPRVEAWRRLGERTDVDTVRMLVSILVQADQFGTGLSKTLRVQADTLRTRRRQRVEELAAKTSVKLVFPLVFFIFPSLFVVTLGPAFILMSDAFKNLHK
jgi:tight adherence protein C